MAPNKFKERPSGDSRMHENLLTARSPPRIRLEKLTALPRPHTIPSITERRVPELIPVLGSQPAGDASPKPGGRLPLLSTRPAVTLATVNRAATSFAAW